MHSRKLHLHSMLVHSVLALVPLAAVAFALDAAAVSFGGFGPEVWRFLAVASLAIALAVALPATASGILERSHAYVTWSATHKAKLALSLVLLAARRRRARHAGRRRCRTSPSGVMVVAINPVVAFLLSAFGLKMTLGRQSLAGTSYVPDLDQRAAGRRARRHRGHLAEPPDLIDILEEMARSSTSRSPAQQELRAQAKAFTEEWVAPNAAKHDRSGEFPPTSAARRSGAAS